MFGKTGYGGPGSKPVLNSIVLHCYVSVSQNNTVISGHHLFK